MKRVAILLSLGVFLAVSCEKGEQQESYVSNVSFTSCQQSKLRSSSELSDKVEVEFTNKGVHITYCDFEVTCDFTTVNVTHTLINGVLNITQQGSPNHANCICHTDVSYTINGISQNEVNIIFINGVQVYCYNDKENESLIFSFHRVGGWIGLNETLKINEDFTHYSISYREFGTWEPKSYQTTIKTSDEKWSYLTRTFNLETFTKIKDGSCRACVDGYDEAFSFTKVDKTYSIYNGNADEHFQQMQDFFDSIFGQVENFEIIAGFR